MRLRRSIIPAVAFVIAFPAAASAQGPASPAAQAPTQPNAAPNPARDEARVRYERGAKLYNEGDYKLALIEFERSYELYPSLPALYNIAQVNYQLNNFAAALKTYRQYLQKGQDTIPDDRRKQVEADILQLQARTAILSVKTDVPGADVSIDDLPAGKAPVDKLLIDAGKHKVVVSARGHDSVTKVLTLAAQDDETLTLKLPLQRTAVTPPPESPNYLWVGWVATGLLGAGAITTGVFTLSAYGDFKDAKQEPVAAGDTDGAQKRQSIDDAESKTRTLATVTTILAAATVVAGGVTIYFTLKRKSDRAVQVGVTPGGLVLGGSF